ncbi:MAG: fibronectin type III domain-containing protein, partial [Actinomycetota bacterium]
WTAPASNGGSAITGYTVTSSPGGFTCTSKTTSCTVTGLTNGTGYTFTVKATNVIDNSPASSASTSVTPAGPPGSPTSVTASAGNTRASVSWTAPASNGGSAITGYTVTSSPGQLTCTSASTSCSVTGLTNGTGYTFTVTATNSVGSSSASSASNSITPFVGNLPIAPTNVKAAFRCCGEFTDIMVTWDFPTPLDGTPSVTSWTVKASPGGMTCVAPDPTQPICFMNGFTMGTAYTFTVTATNSVGTSPSSAATSPALTPYSRPGAVTQVTAVAGIDQAVISWSPPASDGGKPITKYTATGATPGKTVSCSYTVVTPEVDSCTFTGLTSGVSYVFWVTATNSAGTSLTGLASNAVVPYNTPNTPSALNLVSGPGLGEMYAAWNPTTAANARGSNITLYTVTLSPGGATCTFAPTVWPESGVDHCSFKGLTKGTLYTATYKSTNSVGSSPATAPSSARQVLAVPDAPTGFKATATSTKYQITFSWTAPTFVGSSAITGYAVYYGSAPGKPQGYLPATTLTTTSGNFTSGRGTYFVVVAYNAAGASVVSNEVYAAAT